jgi:hypothetical protein
VCRLMHVRVVNCIVRQARFMQPRTHIQNIPMILLSQGRLVSAYEITVVQLEASIKYKVQYMTTTWDTQICHWCSTV